MSALIEYFAKLSISLAVVWLFYQFVLRRLTFYNHNRWYLLGYSLLSFVIPLIDITPALHQNELTNSGVVQWVPLVYKNAAANTSVSIWNIVSMLILAGMLFMLLRLLVQLISFRQMMKKATLISKEGIQLYQVNDSIIPFSFGNAVFFNVNLHTTEELEKIIRHEFVHVKQHHSIDIIFSEILCLLNWFNPFAWMIRAAIRQNLEFVADNKVLQNGVDRKQYQYLLLKVIGDNQFSIAQKFNFSSLKKRIAMMNKNKSAQIHLLRFLFLLPVLAVILVSFRKEISDTLTGKQKKLPPIPAAVTDTVPEVTKLNSKGYIINVKDQKGECLLVIRNKSGVEVKRLLLTEWNADAATYEAKYGEIPPPPPPPPAMPTIEQWIMAGNKSIKKVDFEKDNVTIVLKDGKEEKYNLNNPAEKEKFEKQYGHLDVAPPSAPVQLPDNVQKININNDKVTVILKNGQKENYDLSNPVQNAIFEKKYGEIPPPPPPPPPYSAESLLSPPAYNIPAPPPPPPCPGESPEPPPAYNVPAPPPPPAVPKLPDYVKGFSLDNNKVVITLKNGEKEYYDLSKPDQKAKFEKKYGEFVPSPPPPPARVEIMEVPVAVSIVEKKNIPVVKSTVEVIEVPIEKSSASPAIQGNPLIVVDGAIIKKGELDKLNPNAIASIDVLKGNSAIALYGDKASEGAIIIKTKLATTAGKEDVYITALEVPQSSHDKNN